MQTLLLKSMAGFQFHADVRLFFFILYLEFRLARVARKIGDKVVLKLIIHFFKFLSSYVKVGKQLSLDLSQTDGEITVC